MQYKVVSSIIIVMSLVSGCASVAKIDKLAKQKKYDDLYSFAHSTSYNGEIRRAAVLYLSKIQDPRVKTQLAQMIAGDPLGDEDRTADQIVDSQKAAVRHLIPYGPTASDELLDALKAVKDIHTKAQLINEIKDPLTADVLKYIYSVSLDPQLSVEGVQTILQALNNMVSANVRACYYYSAIVNASKKSDMAERKSMASQLQPTPAVCLHAGFQKNYWLADTRFAEVFQLGQKASAHYNEKLSQGQQVTMADVKEALSYFEQAASIDPANPLARYSIARIYHLLGNMDVAYTWLEGAVATAPSWGIANGLLCDIQQRMGKLGQAADSCEKAIKNNPDVAWHYYLMGQIAKRRGKFEEAYNSFRKAVELDARAYEQILKNDLKYLAKVLQQMGKSTDLVQ